MVAGIKVRAVVIAVGVAAMLGAAVLPGCKDKESAATDAAGAQQPGSGNKAAVVKITLKADGTILADGVTTSLTALDSRLAKLATDGGQVWYPERTHKANRTPMR